MHKDTERLGDLLKRCIRERTHPECDTRARFVITIPGPWPAGFPSRFAAERYLLDPTTPEADPPPCVECGRPYRPGNWHRIECTPLRKPDAADITARILTTLIPADPYADRRPTGARNLADAARDWNPPSDAPPLDDMGADWRPSRELPTGFPCRVPGCQGGTCKGDFCPTHTATPRPVCTRCAGTGFDDLANGITCPECGAMGTAPMPNFCRVVGCYAMVPHGDFCPTHEPPVWTGPRA